MMDALHLLVFPLPSFFYYQKERMDQKVKTDDETINVKKFSLAKLIN